MVINIDKTDLYHIKHICFGQNSEATKYEFENQPQLTI